MSADLSSESETWRANTPAWHEVLTGVTVTFSKEPCQEDWEGRGVGAVSGVILCLIAGVAGYLEVAVWLWLNGSTPPYSPAFSWLDLAP